MNNKSTHRILSLALSLLMVVALLPMLTSPARVAADTGVYDPKSGIYLTAVLERSYYELMPFIKGSASRRYWREVNPAEGVFDFSGVEDDLRRAHERDQMMTVQIVGQQKPLWMLDKVPYLENIQVVPQVGEAHTMMYWYPAHAEYYRQLIEAFGEYLKNTPYKDNVLGVRFYLNAVGGEHTEIPEAYTALSNWTVPDGVDIARFGLPQPYYTGIWQESFKKIVDWHIEYIYPDVQIFMRTGPQSEMIDEQYPDYFAEGKLSLYTNGGDPTGSNANVFDMFKKFTKTGMTTSFSEPNGDFWGWHTRRELAFCSAQQWFYWRLLNELHLGTSYIGLSPNDCNMLFDGTLSQAMQRGQYPDFVGQAEALAALSFAKRYVGHHANPDGSPGGFVAFREARYYPYTGRYFSTPVTECDFLAESYDVSRTKAVMLAGDSQSRYGTWARKINSGESVTVNFNRDLTASMVGNTIYVNVYYLDDGDPFTVKVGGGIVTITPSGSGVWKIAEIPVSGLNRASDGADVTVTAGTNGPTLHMVEITRQPLPENEKTATIQEDTIAVVANYRRVTVSSEETLSARPYAANGNIATAQASDIMVSLSDYMAIMAATGELHFNPATGDISFTYPNGNRETRMRIGETDYSIFNTSTGAPIGTNPRSFAGAPPILKDGVVMVSTQHLRDSFGGTFMSEWNPETRVLHNTTISPTANLAVARWASNRPLILTDVDVTHTKLSFLKENLYVYETADTIENVAVNNHKNTPNLGSAAEYQDKGYLRVPMPIDDFYILNRLGAPLMRLSNPSDSYVDTVGDRLILKTTHSTTKGTLWAMLRSDDYTFKSTAVLQEALPDTDLNGFGVMARHNRDRGAQAAVAAYCLRYDAKDGGGFRLVAGNTGNNVNNLPRVPYTIIAGQPYALEISVKNLNDSKVQIICKVDGVEIFNTVDTPALGVQGLNFITGAPGVMAWGSPGTPTNVAFSDVEVRVIEPETHTVTLNPNGGSVALTSIIVTNGGTYSALPTPTRNGYAFDGWYTAVSGGTKVNPTDTVNLAGQQTLYAQWTGHSYGEWFVVTVANCIAEGQEKRECTACDVFETRVIAKTAHIDGGNGYCSICGANLSPSVNNCNCCDKHNHSHNMNSFWGRFLCFFCRFWHIFLRLFGVRH